LGVKQLAEELDVSVDHAKNLILGKHIPAVDVGIGSRSFWRVSREDLDRYLDAKRAETARRFGAAS
jgi:excisionase family DNA binding protein